MTKGKGYIHLKNVFSKKKIEKAYKILNKIVNGDKKIQSQQKKFSRDKKYNQKWIFKSKSKISLEDSIYMGDGIRIKQNKQIVIHGVIQDKNIVENWSLTKS